MSTQQPSIIYTLTDEAPRLATASFLPIVRSFAAPAGINVTESDISVAARVLGEFPEYLKEEQRVPNTLAELGKKTLQPDANIIKLPNISASVSQLKAAIAELQSKGYALPDYPDQPKDDKEKEIKARYGKCIGSAVNPVLREGNSDRRAPKAVKEYARKNPHSMAEWSQASRSHVSHMHAGDFYHGEKSMTLDRARDVKMELITKSGKTIVLKPKVSLLDREVIDSMFMSKKALLAFYEKEIRYRRLIGFPPFSRIVLWRVESTAEDIARGKAWELYTILSAALQGREGVTLLPPVEAPLYRLRDFFRWQVALKSRGHQAIRALLAREALLKMITQRRKDLRIVQDVDPADML